MQRDNKLLNRLAIPYIFWIAVFIALPIFLIFWYSITPLNMGNSFSNMMRFTLEHFIRFFTTREDLIQFFNSFRLAFITTLLSFLFGYPMALILANMSGKVRNIILLLIIIPMWTNMLLRLYAIRLIIHDNGILNSIIEFFNRILPFTIPTVQLMHSNFAVVLGMTYSYLPFMILPIYAVIVKMDKDLIHAAYDLGANKWQAFLKINFPLSLPGIISGITMVFLPAATTFIVPSILGGGERMIGQVIEDQFKRGGNNPNYGSALSIILMIVIFGLMALMNYFSNDKERGESLW